MNQKPLILIAEDDPDDQYFFQEAIEVVGSTQVETFFALDGAKLLTLLREMKKSNKRKLMVILDLNMQVKDGQSTLQEIKSDPVLAHIPVVILTTSTNESDRDYCLRHGADAYYRKPDSIKELVNIVRVLLSDFLS